MVTGRTFSFTMVLLLALAGIPGAMATHLTPVQDSLQSAEDAACELSSGAPSPDCENTVTDGTQAALTEVGGGIDAIQLIVDGLLAELPAPGEVEQQVADAILFITDAVGTPPDEGDVQENITEAGTLVDETVNSLPGPQDVLPATPSEVLIAPQVGVVAEAPATEFAYGVVLTDDPLGTLTIDVTPSGGITTSADTLTFDSTNWFQPQVVRVAAVPGGASPLTLETVNHHVAVGSGPFPDGALDSVSVVKAADPQLASLVRGELAPVLSGSIALPDAVEVHETGDQPGTSNSGPYAVFLTFQPAAPVTVSAYVDDAADATVDAGGSNEVTFDETNWFVPQTFTVTAVSDNIDEGEQQVTAVSHVFTSADPYYDGLGPGSAPEVGLTIVDDDVAGFTLDAPEEGISVDEDGAAGSFTVVLDSQPSGPVTIDIDDGATDEFALSAASLSFDASNWDTAQTVTVTPVHDQVDDGDQTQALTLAVNAGTAPADYAGLDPAAVDVTVVDVDAAAVDLSLGALSFAENGGTGTFDVVLGSKPSAPVTLTVASDAAEATVDKATLTFDDANWNTPQTVTVTGVNDDIDRDDTSDVTVSVDAGSASEYTSLGAQTVALSLTDDDVAALSVVGAIVPLTEGLATTASFTVALATQPSGEVTVDVTSQNGQVTFDTSSLTFTDADWDTAQTVIVSVADDDVAETSPHLDAIDITVAAGSASEYLSLTAGPLGVSITDNDVAALVLSTNALTVAEADDGTFTVALATEPTAGVTVDLAVSNGEATVSPASLSFTAADWDTPQTVTVTGAGDDLDDGTKTATVTATPTGDGYTGLTPSAVTVTVTDVDDVVVTLAEPAGPVTEGAAATFTVDLTVASDAPVEVTFATTDGTATGADDFDNVGGTFTVPAGATSATFTVNTVDDALDEDPEDFTVTLTAATGGVDGTATLGATVSQVLEVLDNDLAPEVSFAATAADPAVNPTEGDEAQTIELTIELSAVSGRQVTVGLYRAGGTSDTADLTLNPDDMFEGVLFLTGDLEVVIPAGQASVVVSVPVTDDGDDEQDETVVFGLRNPTNAAIGDDNSFTYTILDDDGPTVRFAAASGSGSEDRRLVKVEVTLSGESVQEVTVDFTVAGTAVAPADHDLAGGTVTFAPGQTSKVISFLVEDDDAAEGDETVVITLDAVDNAEFGTDVEHTYTIEDNDD